MFRERYTAAQDFLDSKKFKDILEKELLDLEDEPEIHNKVEDTQDSQQTTLRLKIQNAVALGLEVLAHGAKHNQDECTLKEGFTHLRNDMTIKGFSGFSDKLKNKLDHKLAELQFS